MLKVHLRLCTGISGAHQKCQTVNNSHNSRVYAQDEPLLINNVHNGEQECQECEQQGGRKNKHSFAQQSRP